jgi:catechol 1,2-dioxygenase
MQRRKFIKETGLMAVGISFFGKVSWAEDKFIADTPTTTDILGPFYRPGSPVRTNINAAGYKGKLFHISGTLFKQDGKTPFKNGRIEIWQCDENKVYDNLSDEFRYRGAQITGADGKYHFVCMHPIPYPAGDDPDKLRPAHIHLLISGEGQQDLITQIYLEGDPHILEDLAAAAPDAVKRILKIQPLNAKEESVQFDIVLAKELKPADAVFKRLTGIYKMNDASIVEFYRQNDLLMMKWKSLLRIGLTYKGNNKFTGGYSESTTAIFELLPGSHTKVKVHFATVNVGAINMQGDKIFNYVG